MESDTSSSIVRLNIGGSIFCTTVDTLTNREPDSMLAAMFSGRHTLRKDSVFIDRDGMHFRHILNWLRDGVAPISNLSHLECSELLQEAKYYQLLGLVDRINAVLNNKKKDADLTRTDIIKHRIKNPGKANLRGVNLSGLDLSKLDLSHLDLSYACLKNVNFLGANLRNANLEGANLEGANLEGANLEGADFKDADVYDANLQHVDLRYVINFELTALHDGRL